LRVSYDTENPKAREDRFSSVAATWKSVAESISTIAPVLSAADLEFDTREIVRRFAIPVRPLPVRELTSDGGAQLFAYHLDAGVVTANEVRSTLNLPPIPGGDELLKTVDATTEQSSLPARNVQDASIDAMRDDAHDPMTMDHASANLAQKMTAHGIARCEHDGVNRCRICGIERVRDFQIDENGLPVWSITWRPIGAEAPPR
jgi:hypothetical protein